MNVKKIRYVISSADECTRALERALEAMNPPFDDDVHEGIISLIANFVPYGELRNRSEQRPKCALHEM